MGWLLGESLLAIAVDGSGEVDGSGVCGPDGGEGIVGGGALLGGGEWTAEKSWVMVGWDGLMTGRRRLREGGWWQC